MKTVSGWLLRAGEFLAAIMMGAMFVVFIIQITIRYTARLFDAWDAGCRRIATDSLEAEIIIGDL